MKNKSHNKIIQDLKEYLYDRVLFALVYGSILKPSFNIHSDVDVAIYPVTYGSQLSDLLSFQCGLNELIQRDVDVVMLDRADLIIAMQVLANGQLIINHNPKMFIEFKAMTISQYIDFKMSRKIIEDQLLKGQIYA